MSKVFVAGVGMIPSAQAMTTDTASTFAARDVRRLVGFDMAKAAEQAYAQAGLGPRDVDVVELHDCFAHDELVSWEALGLRDVGSAEKFVEGGVCVVSLYTSAAA